MFTNAIVTKEVLADILIDNTPETFLDVTERISLMSYMFPGEDSVPFLTNIMKQNGAVFNVSMESPLILNAKDILNKLKKECELDLEIRKVPVISLVTYLKILDSEGEDDVSLYKEVFRLAKYKVLTEKEKLSKEDRMKMIETLQTLSTKAKTVSVN